MSQTMSVEKLSHKKRIVNLKKDIKEIFELYKPSNDHKVHNELMKFINSYDGMIKILDDFEKRELEDNSTKSKIVFIKNKYRIQRIVTKYNLMSSLIGIYDIFNEAFLMSSASRRSIFSDDGAVFFSKKNKEGGHILEFFSLEDCVKNNEEEELKDKLKTMVQTKEPGLDFHLQLWQGCEMTMPKGCKITLSFSQIYPSLYIKRIDNNDEIFIEEHPWNINYIADKDLLNYNNENQFLSDVIAIENWDRIKRRTGSISKNQLSAIIRDEENVKDEFQKIELEVLKALDECDVVIQMPYITPRADILLQVSFNDNVKKDSNAEIILTTC
ncbi:hypothetical protein [Aquimarina aggregata]|uniref:hypothetical protein n=1 Tax=Aquimarina aggregata TaxID=1642818 RepID=UPI0024916667|nr:hypothetical protein [Aquimarina aggregata]